MTSTANPVPTCLNSSETGIEVREYTDDFKIYRYADAILMRAEIQNALASPVTPLLTSI